MSERAIGLITVHPTISPRSYPPFFFFLLLLLSNLPPTSPTFPTSPSSSSSSSSGNAKNVDFIVNDRTVTISVKPDDDINGKARDFCKGNNIVDDDGKCELHVYLEFSDKLYCEDDGKVGDDYVDVELSPDPSALRTYSTYQFIHSPLHYDSSEFDLLRSTFRHYDYHECWPSSDLHPSNVSITWVLGHATTTVNGMDLIRLGSIGRGRRVNTMIGTENWGNKDKLHGNLMTFAKVHHLPDLSFVPRTWGVSDLSLEHVWMKETIEDGGVRGEFILKVPDVELGGGIEVVDMGKGEDRAKVLECSLTTSTFVDSDGLRWGEENKKGTCVLQKYVSPPLLFKPYKESPAKKFSFGVYIHVRLDPYIVLMHDELLVLFASKAYEETGSETLGHLTNGLLNQRLNPDYDELKHVWDGGTFRRVLKETYGVEFDTVVKPQVREIISATIASGMEKVRLHTVSSYLDGDDVSKSLPNTFVYLRVDFLLDTNFKAWLLECEIVPSTGSIGGNDEILKRRVMHDTFALLEVEKEDLGEVEYVKALIEAGKRANEEEIDYVESGKSGLGMGGFECVFPCVNKESEMEVNVFRALRGTHELNSDRMVRDYWGSGIALDGLDGAEGTGEKERVRGFGEGMITSECNRCAGFDGFCTTPISIEPTGQVSFLGKCVAKGDPCLHSLHGFMDARRITDCGEIRDDNFWIGDVVATSGIAYLTEFQEGFESLCDAAFPEMLKATGAHLNYEGILRSERLRSICNMFKADGKEYYHRRLGEITQERALGGGLADFARMSVPCVVRGGGRRSEREWSVEALKREYGQDQVNALIFDRGDGGGGDSGGDINAVGCTFDEFTDYALKGFEVEGKAAGGGSRQEIYLLLTSRGMQGAVTMDPNPDSRLLELLNFAGFEDKVLAEAGLTEAWSNLRMGVGYDYPVHIDCFDNVIVQLKGKKMVSIWDPETVEGWRPRLDKKHWPGTTEEERRGKWKGVIERGSWGSIELEEGDTIFIPAMYFHSVTVEEGGWSVTGNRYYYKGGGAEGWNEVMERRKGYSMREYEEKEGGVKVC